MEPADTLRKQGGFIPGVRPGSATAAYIKNVLNHITLPGAIFIALVAVVPSIVFTFTGNSLVQAFGGTSILIMVGVALDTIFSDREPAEDRKLRGTLHQVTSLFIVIFEGVGALGCRPFCFAVR